MSDFTPGPWNFHPCDEYVNSFDVLCEEGYYVATTHDGVRGDKNADANARLIAAAPDLLRYLKEARRTLEMWKDVVPAVSLCADIDAAIAKATGESE